MKTYKNLYPQIYEFESLYIAWRKARAGKRYRPTVAQFEQHLDVELATLQSELQSEAWQPGGYRSFSVHEPKRRKISAAPFRDRVVHHALVNVLNPIYERKFVFDSYANRVGKGTHKALDRCTHFMRRYPYVLQCDIQQFFPAIDHAVLKSILAQTIACPATLRLCSKIIDSGQGILNDQYTLRYFPGDDLFAPNRSRGLPIGNLTSQFWANVYLNPLDHFVKRTLKTPGYVRYVDDFLLFANTKTELHYWLGEVIGFLQTLRLTMHTQRAFPCPVKQGIPFLGFTVYPDHRRLKRAKVIHWRRRLKYLWQSHQLGLLAPSKLQASMMAWLGHVQHGDTLGLQKNCLNVISF